MTILISHSSALSYWRNLYHREKHDSLPCRLSSAPAQPPNITSFDWESMYGFTYPLHVSVSTKSTRRRSDFVHSHLIGYPLAKGSVYRVSDELLVSSPEFCFLQMAGELSLYRLIKLGYELCGTYSLRDTGTQDDFQATDDCTFGLNPLTDKQKLTAYLSNMPEATGQPKATSALRHITDGSASPMETLLTMLLTLPRKHGGYGFSLPELNAHIYPDRYSKEWSSQEYFKCDLF